MTAKIDRKKSDRILAEVKKRTGKEKIVDVDEEKVKLVIFSLLDDYYAFDSLDVKEVLPVGKITYVPGSPDYIIGIINVRGDIESVLNIHKFLEIPEGKTNKNNRIAIAVKGDVRSGILLDSVLDVVDVLKSSIKPPISTLNKSIRDFVVGETTYNNKNTTLLDVGKMFGRIRG